MGFAERRESRCVDASDSAEILHSFDAGDEGNYSGDEANFLAGTGRHPSGAPQHDPGMPGRLLFSSDDHRSRENSII